MKNRILFLLVLSGLICSSIALANISDTLRPEIVSDNSSPSWGNAAIEKSAASPGDQLVQPLNAATDFPPIQYDLQIIAQTGQSFSGNNPITRLGTWPSISDSGRVAFTASLQDATEAVGVGDGSSLEERSLLANSFYYRGVPGAGSQINDLNQTYLFGDSVQINNQDQVLWRAIPRDGLIAVMLRQGPTANDFKLVAKSDYRRIDFPNLDSISPFDAKNVMPPRPVFYPGLTMNNRVSNITRPVFSGVLRSDQLATVVATPVDPENGGTDNASDYSMTNSVSGYPSFYPMISDNNLTVVRSGNTTANSIIVLTNVNLSSAQTVAGSPAYTALGSRPGISDDGRFISFVANSASQGFGIYLKPNPSVTIKIAGIAGDGILDPGETWHDVNGNGVVDLGEDDGPFLSSGLIAPFWLTSRVGVNKTSPISTTNYTVAYLANVATDPSNNEKVPQALYVSRIDATTVSATKVSSPTLIVQAGDRIFGLSGIVTRIDLYDPVNNNGQVAFWVKTSTGDQAIIRTNPSTIDTFDPVCEDKLNCNGEFLKDVSGQVLIDQNKLDSIVSTNVRRKGVVVDGVSTLLLRFKADGPVTFTLKDPSGATADSRWGALGDLGGTSESNTVTVNPIMTSDGYAAFAIYRSPLDLPCSYNAQPCTLAEISGSLQVAILTNSSNSASKKLLNFLPPPLVFVHGVWSDGTALWSMGDYLEEKGFSVAPGCRVDYGTKSPAGTFDPLATDTYVVKKMIESTKDAVWFMRIQNIAATKVDVIGHSMGGLVAREMTVFEDTVDRYEAIKNYNKGSIHKIITIGTPHLGTQMADFLIQNKCNSLVRIGITLESFFNKQNKPLGPAIFGFQTASPSIQNLGATKVPSHTIVGLAPSFSVTEEKLNVVIRAFVSLSENVDHIIKLGGNGHDTIVPRESQEGAVGSLATSAFSNIVHADLSSGVTDTEEPRSQAVWDEVKRLLLTLTSAAAFDNIPQVTGTPTFPVNKYLTPEDAACSASASEAPAMTVSTATTTLLPDAGTTFTPGQTVNVQFDVLGGNPVEGALFVVGDKLEALEGSAPFAFSFPAPNDYIGDMNISAYTFGSGPENYTAETTITILPAGPFVSLKAFPDSVRMDQIGLSRQINVRGYYLGGASVPVTRAHTGTSYSTQSGTNNIISVSPDGLVQSHTEGNDAVVVTNRGQSTTVTVEVKVFNHAPVLAPISDRTIIDAGPLTFTVSATDPDGNTVSLFSRMANGDPVSSIGAVFTDNHNGTGTFSWTPAANQPGDAFLIIFTAVDPGGLSASKTAMITLYRKAKISYPAPGTRLRSSSVTFSWAGASVGAKYKLLVGTGPGLSDIYSGSEVSATSASVSRIPITGQPVYVTLSTMVGGLTGTESSSYPTGSPARITSPSPGTTLMSTQVYFSWGGGLGVTEYSLKVGSAPGQGNIYSAEGLTATSRKVTGIPMNGQTVYAVLGSKINGQWVYDSYSPYAPYRTAVFTPAQISTPANGSTLNTPNVRFFWSGGQGVDTYKLMVGRTAGAGDIYNQSVGTATTAQVTGIPLAGGPVYVRLISMSNSQSMFKDYVYPTTTAQPGQLTYPAPGTLLSYPSVFFSWSAGKGVSKYSLSVGKSAGASDIYRIETTGTTASVSSIPLTGQTLFVRLGSLINGNWVNKDYTYPTMRAVPAQITSPSSGTRLTTSSIMFRFSPVPGAMSYRLTVGTSLGGSNVSSQYLSGSQNSTLVNNIPLNGQTVYVRLWTQFSGITVYSDSSYPTSNTNSP